MHLTKNIKFSYAQLKTGRIGVDVAVSGFDYRLSTYKTKDQAEQGASLHLRSLTTKAASKAEIASLQIYWDARLASEGLDNPDDMAHGGDFLTFRSTSQHPTTVNRVNQRLFISLDAMPDSERDVILSSDYVWPNNDIWPNRLAAAKALPSARKTRNFLIAVCELESVPLARARFGLSKPWAYMCLKRFLNKHNLP